MPRSRGAAATRSDTRRKRGEHDNKTNRTAADERRSRDHARAEATTDSLQLFINSAMKYPLLTGPEEIELAKRIEKGDLAAKEKLINSNLRLVIKFARRYQGHGLDLGDIVQEAMLGLIRAAEKFDWRRGYKFSTYAVLWIKQSIQRGLDNSGRAVRIPAHIAQRERTVNRITAELTTKLDREPTDEEVAKEAKLPLDEVMATRDLTRVTTSLDQPVGDGDTTFGELNAESTAELEEEVLEREQEQAVDAALERLPEQERKIIRARFGTGGTPERPLRDAAREVGVTQEQARRLEERALARLSADGALAAWRDAA
ncbi:MAG: polymerase, sigma 70 subunit, RpoD subfamily [Solirubrobacterales bacterium]|jgi:RNA polymerase primary sigma factor|nr:polymerase, sigma 70 subunit, RpoD subfamily [Solirubrobacterales bacterium]HZA58856.1 sigma-70 family RNA polymerase sigma factor [Solirubrobacterales bacterium]